jgi:hypothetical protein
LSGQRQSATLKYFVAIIIFVVKYYRIIIMDAITIAKIRNLEDRTRASFVVADKNGKQIRVIEDIKDILLYVNKVYVGIIDNLTTDNSVKYYRVLEAEAMTAERTEPGVCQGDVKVFVRSPFEDEGQLLDVILDNAELLTCYNCGEIITNVAHRGGNVAVLNIDPGENNYPHSPDEPASAAFTCFKCFDEPSSLEMQKKEGRDTGYRGCQ